MAETLSTKHGGTSGPGSDTSAYHSTDAALTPSADFTQALGTALKRLADIIAMAFHVYSNPGDANPTAILTDAGIGGVLALGASSADNLSFVLQAEGAGIAKVLAGSKLQLEDAPAAPKDAVNKAYADANGFPDVSARFSSTIAIPPGAPGVILWDQEEFKTAGITHDNAILSSRIVVNDDGKYLFGAYAQSAAATIVTLGYRVNGGGFVKLTDGISGDYVNFTNLLALNAGDYIEIEYSSTGGFTAANTAAWIRKVG